MKYLLSKKSYENGYHKKFRNLMTAFNNCVPIDESFVGGKNTIRLGIQLNCMGFKFTHSIDPIYEKIIDEEQYNRYKQGVKYEDL